MIVLDASVLIAHLDAADALHDRATGLLMSVADQQLAASAVTLAEVLVGPARAGQLGRAMGVLAQLRVRTLGLGEEAPPRLAALRAETRLKLPDCCVLLASGEEGGASLATFDSRLGAAARARGVKVLPGNGR